MADWLGLSRRPSCATGGAPCGYLRADSELPRATTTGQLTTTRNTATTPPQPPRRKWTQAGSTRWRPWQRPTSQ
eukprot:8559964-Lingulodinium_polyedra.AAC.1